MLFLVRNRRHGHLGRDRQEWTVATLLDGTTWSEDCGVVVTVEERPTEGAGSGARRDP